jgi:hypothetical protein
MQRYRDYNTYLKELFGERVQKIPLDAGFSCPNRDGKISDQGCIYCNRLGSGTGAFIKKGQSIDEQILAAKQIAQRKYKAKLFIAYFQAFTNTYAPLSHLKNLYDQALSHPGLVGLAVGTRPDCVDEEIMELLHYYQEKYLVWVELGLQSCHDETLKRINRGHDAACFKKAAIRAHAKGLNICSHIILGLPGENRAMMLETARFLADLPVQGIKIHLLYVVKDSPLAGLYQQGELRCLEPEEYFELVADVLELLPPDMIIQRLTAEPFGDELLAPRWALDKQKNLSGIKRTLEKRNTWQGRLFSVRK